MTRTAQFRVDVNKCNGCGKCISVCPGNMTGGNVIHMQNGIPVMTDQSNFGWRGCWRCQHCLSVCPNGAVSILGVSPDQVSEKPDGSIRDEFTRLVSYRRTCRSYQNRDVDPKIIHQMLETMGNVPTGGNSFGLEFSVVESSSAMRKLCDAMFPYQQMDLFRDEKSIGRLGIYNAPHLFIAHKVVGRRFHDGDLTELGIATAYFELLANSFGLGTVITNYAAEQILKNKEARRLLEIPEDHTALAAVGFGYPAISYSRGVKKYKRVHYLK